jgi:hypothetical protein
MRRSFLILSVALSLPALGQAQHSGGMAVSGAHLSATPVPVAVARVAGARPAVSARPAGQPGGRVSTRLPVAPRTTHPAGWNTGARHNHNNVPGDSVFPNGNLTVDGYPVPGLGFDYPHFFATHPNAGRHCRHCFDFGSGFVVPFIDGGFYLPTSVYGDQQAAAQPAEAEAAPDQQPAVEEPPARETVPSRMQSQPIPAQQEYVFVKRDGTLIFAVAYSWINDRLQYVTGEGIRRTIPRNTLDLDATQQFNDQRGVPIQLPA